MNFTRFLLITTISLMIASCSNNSENERQLERMEVKLDSLNTLLEAEISRSDSLAIIINQKDSLDDSYPLFFGKKYEDIENPEEYIQQELRNQQDLIPLSGVLGGTMAFREIEVISEKWVLAIYDDGHIQGKSIFEYQLQPDDSVKFSLVATQHN